MFKFIATLIALFTALNSYTATPAKDAPSKEEQHALYEELLTDIATNNDWGIDISDPGPGWLAYGGEMYYTFFDLDGDGVDELLTGEDLGEQHGIILQHITYISDGKVVPLRGFIGFLPEAEDGLMPEVYSNGIIVFSEHINWGHEIYSYSRFENGKIVSLGSIDDTSEWGMWKITASTGSKTTECAVPGFIAKLIVKYIGSNNELAELDWKPVAQFAQPTVTAN